jgi:hypothetical protein
MANIGAQRLVANSQKPAIGGPFSERQGHFLRAPDWLAGVRGFELTHSRSNPVSICPSVNLGIWASRTTRLHCTRVPAEFALYLGGSGAWPLSRRVRLHTGENVASKEPLFSQNVLGDGALRAAHSRDCSDCFRLGAIAGWDFHPLESAAFARRTPKPDIGLWRRSPGNHFSKN